LNVYYGLRSPSVSGYKMLLKIQMTAEFKV